jgi:arabinofuranan 3-O-arabinosyltransferase
MSWTPVARVLRVTAGAASYLVVNENFNSGWIATIGKRTLQPVRLDGWKQGWSLPAGTSGVVTLTYSPATSYTMRVVAGLCALGLVIAVAAVPRRRWRRGRRWRRPWRRRAAEPDSAVARMTRSWRGLLASRQPARRARSTPRHPRQR